MSGVTVDANVLIHAADGGSARNERARALLDWLIGGSGIVHVFWPTVMAFLRIATHPSVFATPLRPEEATAAVDGLLRRPNVRAEGEGPDFWLAYRGVAGVVSPRGNLVPDAHLVALMRQHGVGTIWTGDRDFRKFDGVTAKDPFDPRFGAGFR